MNSPQKEAWSGRLAFILASIGAAVGLGNIWKFPYSVGSSGGSAFVLVYVIAILLVATPIMLAEMVLGPDFEVTGHESTHPLDWTEEEIARSEQYNKQLLEETKLQLQAVSPGDHEAISPFLGKVPREPA